MKKFLLINLCVIMILSAMPITATGAYRGTKYGDYLYYEINEDGETITITDCDENVISVNIPAEIDGLPVTEIGWYAFEHCDSLTSVTIPGSVTSIGKHAFEGCSSLTSVTIPSGVTSIGDSAFEWCESLTSVMIPNSVTSIGNLAFSGCDSLTSITIPSSVTSIDSASFSVCGSLNISVDSGNKNYSDIDGVLFNKDKTEIIKYAKDKIQPEYSIPNSVTSIGDGAFSYCESLTNVKIPDSVTSICWSAFYFCYNLTSITIPSSVTSIGDWAFYYTAYYNDKSNWQNGVLYIGDCLIKANSDELPSSYAINDGTRVIAGSAFYYCESLTSITIPSGVTSIGYWAFEGCESLTSVTIPSSVTSIGEGAFASCGRSTDVYYGGSKADWQRIDIGDYNGDLLNANIHYNSVIDTEPTKFAGVPTVSAGNGVYNVSATLQDIDKSCVMVAALYNGRKLAGVKIINLSKGQTIATAAVSAVRADIAKVCIWDSLDTMRPLCEPKTITIK